MTNHRRNCHMTNQRKVNNNHIPGLHYLGFQHNTSVCFLKNPANLHQISNKLENLGILWQ